MNTVPYRFLISSAVLTLSLLFGADLHAQPCTNFRPRDQAGTVPASSATTNLLSQAYAALSVADHDYQGHRIRAMRQIEAAAKEVGITLRGDGRGQELQATSDQQLRTAQSLLKQAVTGLHERAKHHVEKALEHLSIALSVN